MQNIRPDAGTLLRSAALLALIALSSPIAAQAQTTTDVQPPESYESYGVALAPPMLTARQRLSIERGAADLGGATEQSLLATILYITSAATLIGGVATAIVLFAEFNPMGPGGYWNTAELAILGSAIASLAVHAITTPLAISVGLNAQRRHARAREELLLTHITVTPFGAALAGQF